jgi:hypothetical protein
MLRLRSGKPGARSPSVTNRGKNKLDVSSLFGGPIPVGARPSRGHCSLRNCYDRHRELN